MAPHRTPAAAVLRRDQEPGPGDRRVARRSARDRGEYFSRTDRGPAVRDPLPAPADTGCPTVAAPDAAGEQVLLDENVLAAGHDYFALGGFDGQPRPHAPRVLRRRHTAASATTLALPRPRDRRRPARRRPQRVLRLGLGERRPHVLLRATRRRHAPVAGLAPHARHARRRRRARVPGGRRALLPSVGRTRTGRYIVVDRIGSKITSEVWFVRRRRPEVRRRWSTPRRDGRRVRRRAPPLADHGDRFFVVTNDDGAENFKLVVTRRCDHRAASTGRELVPHRADVKLDDSTRSRTTSCCRSAPRARTARRATPRRRRHPRRRDARPRVQRLGRSQPGVRDPHRSIRVHVAGRAGHRRRLRPRGPRAHARQAPARPRRLRPRRVRVAPRSGRRHPTAPRARSRSCTAATLRSTAPRRRCCTATARTRSRSTRRSRSSRLSPARPRLRVRDRAHPRRR